MGGIKRSDIPTKAVLNACHKFHNGSSLSPMQTLVNEFNAPEKVIYSAIERECNAGRVDYGVSLCTAWVTPEGYDFLENN